MMTIKRRETVILMTIVMTTKRKGKLILVTIIMTIKRKGKPILVITVKPPRRDRIGDGMFGPCREVGPISEVSFKFIVCHRNPLHNDRISCYNQLQNDYESIYYIVKMC